MFFHKKDLIHSVQVDEANPRFAQLLLEQFGGATGELSAALQYWVQSFHISDEEKDQRGAWNSGKDVEYVADPQ